MNNTTDRAKPKYFYCYLDNETILQHLSDEPAGSLWKMLFAYTNRGEKPNIIDPVVAMAFDVMIQQIDRDFKKYQDMCEKNRQNRLKANDRQRPSTIVNGGNQDKDKNKDKDKDKNKDKDKDKDKNKDKIDTLSTSVDGRNAFDYQSVVNSFNSICTSLPKVQKLTDTRKKKIKNASKLLGSLTFGDVFNMVENSDFLSGRNGKWTACCFDWILNPTNLTKIIEGNYDNKVTHSSQPIRNYEEEF